MISPYYIGKFCGAFFIFWIVSMTGFWVVNKFIYSMKNDMWYCLISAAIPAFYDFLFQPEDNGLIIEFFLCIALVGVFSVVEVRKGKRDKYGHLKNSGKNDVSSLYSGTEQICSMLFANKSLYPNGENDIDKSKIFGLCAYLIAGWRTYADPKTAQDMCYTYGNNFQLSNKPVSYANEMLQITNDTYREIRAVTDELEKTTISIPKLIRGQAEHFAELSFIPAVEANITAIEDAIYYFINEYLIPNDGSVQPVQKTTPMAEITNDVTEQEKAITIYDDVHEAEDVPEESTEQALNDESSVIQQPLDIEQKSSKEALSTRSEQHAQDRFCRACGKKIPDGGTFCPICGMKVIESGQHEAIDDTSIDQLRKLKQLYDEGILTEEEFSVKKHQILKL